MFEWPKFFELAAAALMGSGAAWWYQSRRHRRNRRAGMTPSQVAARLRLNLGPNVVAVGGGTGLSTLLSGVKAYSNNLTAVVTVTDEGGSSGRITREWGLLPPGDIRNCLVALCEHDEGLRDLLDFRFDRGDLQGHSLGNLMLLAAAEQTGDFAQAVGLMNTLLALRGEVLPVTAESVTLVGTLDDGRQVSGELEVTRNGGALTDLRLEPRDPKPVKAVLTALQGADLICLGPGSLFTSVIPNLLVPEFRKALLEAPVPLAYIANLMTQPQETQGLTALGHLRWIERVLGRLPDWFVVNSDPVPPEVLSNYRSHGAEPLVLSQEEEKVLEGEGCRVLRASLLRLTSGLTVRHHSGRLAEALLRITREEKRT